MLVALCALGLTLNVFTLSKFDLKNKDFNLNKGFQPKPQKNRHICMINSSMCIAKKLKDP
jgi:hypothetical protein